MNDAIYAPYKGKWRWWLGARLWLLVIMFILNSVYSSDNPSLLLFVHVALLMLFILAQALIKPFGETVPIIDKYYKQTLFFNQFFNWLDLFYMLNYIALASSMLYILDHQSLDRMYATITVGGLVGLFAVVVMITVLYHVIVAILKLCDMFDKTKEKILNLISPVKMRHQYMELDEPIYDDSDEDDDQDDDSTRCALREPLTENTI